MLYKKKRSDKLGLDSKLKRKILFLTGTRADFGKLKSLINVVHNSESLDCSIFATGMHLMARYGLTVNEIHKAGFTNIHTFMNQIHGEPMELILANTISGLSRYVHECKPDMIVVHGDRLEALAGAIVGAMQNILVAHIEGGEISGTIDELIRHAVTKLSHIHFVANKTAAERLKQLGEDEDRVFIIGSPDIDIMLHPTQVSFEFVKEHYEIGYDKYSIVMFHPDTTETACQEERAEGLVESLVESNRSYIVLYPNNDLGSEYIFNAYKVLKANKRFRIFPSLRFEYFLVLLRNADFLIGNSSTGIFEAPVYGVPTINIGDRQKSRFMHDSILNVDYSKDNLLEAIQNACNMSDVTPSQHYGDGRSAERFKESLNSEKLWRFSTQKQFRDIVAMWE